MDDSASDTAESDMAPNYQLLSGKHDVLEGGGFFSRNGKIDTNLLKQPLKVSWHDISIYVRVKTAGGLFSPAKYERRRILNNVSGVAKQGTLTAIMGSSGAGKTTMLAAVSHRMRGDMVGQVLLNGHVVDARFMAQVSGFMAQQDLAIDCLTVREHMEMMGRLKLDRRVRATQREHRLNALLADLGLAHCTSTRLSALSGGERRRVSLAVELVTDPPVLFCDEPTTGLDSYSAEVVVDLLRRYAARGKVVVCTIHQPASGIFDMFHRVVLLANGRLAFHGNVADASRHFDSLGLECPSTYNQAEFLVTQLAIVPGQEVQSRRRVEALCDRFDESQFGLQLQKELDGIARPQRQRCCSVVHMENDLTASIKSGCSCTYTGKEGIPFEKYLTIQKVSRFTQFYWLLWRSSIESRRNPSEWLIGFSLFMFTAVLISVPYTDLRLNQKGIQNMQGFLYLIITEVIFTFAYNVFHTFPREVPIMLREIGGGLYQPGPYYLSKMIGLIPRAVIEPFIYLIVIFLISDLRGGTSEFFLLCLPIWACSICATAYGCFMSAVFESMETAVLVSVPYEFVSVTFCGLYLKLRNLPTHLSWVQYISQFYYGNEAVSILQWNQIERIECEKDPLIPCISTGDGALAKYGFDKADLGLDFIGFGSIYLFCHIFGFLAVWRRSKRQAVY